MSKTGKKVDVKAVEKKVRCDSCRKEYGSLDEAMVNHTPDTALTHTIRPITRVRETRPQIGRVPEGQAPVGEPLGIGMLSPTTVGETELERIMRKYPYLINPDARELNEGVAILEEIDRRTMAAARSPRGPTVDFKGLPTFTDAEKAGDEEMSRLLQHTPGCAGDAVVQRSKTMIKVLCGRCGSSLSLVKR